MTFRNTRSFKQFMIVWKVPTKLDLLALYNMLDNLLNSALLLMRYMAALSREVYY